MVKKLFIYITGDVLVKGLGFLTLPLYSHLILPDEYGTLGLLNAIVAFMPVVLTLSYINGFVRFHIDIDDKTVVSTFVFLGSILNLIYFVIALLIYEFIVYRYEIPFKYFLLAIITSISIFIFHILLVYFQSNSNAKAYMKITVFFGLSGIVYNLIFLLLFEDNILAMLLAGLTNTLIISVYTLNILRESISWTHVDFSLAKEVLRYTSPLTFGAIGLLIFSQMDKLILAEYITKLELGIYVMAFSISLAISYLGRALFISYQPTFLQLAKQNNNLIIEKYHIIVLFIFGSMILTFIAIGIIYQLIDVKYYIGIKVAFVNTIAYAFLVYAQMMELHLSYKKKSIASALIYGTGGFLTIALLYYFIPQYGMIGASYALVISGFIISVLMFFIAQKYFYLKYDNKITVAFYLALSLSFILVTQLV